MNLSIKVQPSQLVNLHDDKITTTSLIVAEAFGKQHKNVLRAIQNLECSEEFRLLNFEQSSYINEQNREMLAYEITKDGFMFLVMGFTGARAAQWKEAFINAFNKMENQLKGELILPNEQTCQLKEQVITLQERVINLMEDLANAKLPRKRAPRKNNAQLTATERDLIITLANKGHSQAAIARQLNRSTGFVSMFMTGYKAAQGEFAQEVQNG